MDLDQLILDGASKGSWAAIAAMVVWVLVALLKSDLPLMRRIPLPPEYRPIVAVALGQLYAVLEMILHGMPPIAAIGRGLGVAFAAIGLHEVATKAREAGKGPSSGPPPLPPMGILLLVLVGCSPLKGLVRTADAAAATAEAARPILKSACTDPMVALLARAKEAKAAADVPALVQVRTDLLNLDTKCDGAIGAQDTLLRAHAALRAAIVALHAGQLPPNAAKLAADLVAAAVRLGEALSELKGGR